MKIKHILTLVLLIAHVGLYAQELASPIMFIFGEEDYLDGHPVSEIDSITFHRNGDGRLVQNIWSAHTSTSLQVSKIEKIQIVEEETKLNSKVFPFTVEHDPYIVGYDDTCIYLKAETPVTLVPRKSDIIAASYDCSALENGFIGRVKSVDSNFTSPDYDGNVIKVECTPASIDDLYDKIVYAGTMENETEQQHQRANKPERIDGSLKTDLWNKNFSSSFGKDNCKANVNVGDRASMRLVVCKTDQLPLSVSIHVDNYFSSSFSHHAEISGTYEPDPVQIGSTLRIGRISFPHPLLRFIWLEPQFKISGYMELEGALTTDLRAHFNRTDSYILKLSNGRWKISHNGSNDANIDVAQIDLNGSIEIGLIPELMFSLNGTKNGIGLSSKNGLNLNANFQINGLEINEGTYAMLKDSQLDFTEHSDISVFCKESLFSAETARHEYNVADMVLPIWTKYFLPEFSISDVDYSNYTAYYNVSRNLVMPVELGSHLYDKDGNKISSVYDGDIYDGTSEHNYYWQHKVTNHSKSYELYPVVKIAGVELRAIPPVKFKNCPMTIKGYEQTGTIYSPDDYMNHFTFDLDVELNPDSDEVLEWGVVGSPTSTIYIPVDEPGMQSQTMNLRWGMNTTEAIDEGYLDFENYRFEVNSEIYGYAIVRNRETAEVDTLYTRAFPMHFLYDKKPKIQFSNASIGETEVIQHEEGNDENITHYSYHAKMDGAFWMLNGEWQYTNGWFALDGDPTAPLWDYDGVRSNYCHYYDDSPCLEFSTWIDYTLRSTGARKSSNCLNFYGDGHYIVGVTISDKPLYVNTRNAVEYMRAKGKPFSGKVSRVKTDMDDAMEKYKNAPIINFR